MSFLWESSPEFESEYVLVRYPRYFIVIHGVMSFPRLLCCIPGNTSRVSPQLCFGFPVLSFRSWSYSVHVKKCNCFVLSLTSPGGA